MEKPISMAYAEARQEVKSEIMKVMGKYQLPFFLADAILSEIKLDIQKESMNELSFDSNTYIESLKKDEEKEG